MPRDRAARWRRPSRVALPVMLLAGVRGRHVHAAVPAARHPRGKGRRSSRPTARSSSARGIGPDTNVFHLDTGSIVTALEADP